VWFFFLGGGGGWVLTPSFGAPGSLRPFHEGGDSPFVSSRTAYFLP